MSQLAIPKVPGELRRAVRHAFYAWVDSVRDPDGAWHPRGAVVLVIVVSVVTGALVVLSLNGATFRSSTAQGTSAARPAEAIGADTSTTTGATRVAAAPPSSTQRPAPFQAARAAPPFTSSVAGAVAEAVPPTSTAQPPANFSPTPVQPTAEQTWLGVLARLDTVWGVDTQATVAILDDFRAQFPDYVPARDKLYAALLSNAADLATDGATQDATELLTRASALEPERLEARVALEVLTPTPTPVLPPEEEETSIAGAPVLVPGSPAPTPRVQPAPAPARTAPAPVPRPAVAAVPPQQAPPPTPTKIPFRPPTGP